MLDRLGIAAALREIAALIRLQGGQRFRARAYDGAGAALEALAAGDDVLGDAASLAAVPGIGPSTARTIVELRTSGSTDLLVRLRAEAPRGVLQLRQVPHLTVRRIELLQQALGVTNVDELEAACRDGRVLGVRGFGQVTVDKLLAGIRTWRDRGDAMLLLDADREGAALRAFARTGRGVGACELAGPARRRAELVDAIVLVVAAMDPAAAIVHCTKYPPAIAVTEHTDRACTLRLASGAVAQVHAVLPARFPEELVRATGSAAHVARLEALAHGRRVRGRLRGDGEARVYGRLGLPFVPPELREDAGEIEAAVAGRLPALVTDADIRGFVHCHTDWSDGRHTIEAMARAADAAGMAYLTITDHSAAAHYANGLSADRLRAQWDEIARVQDLVAVRLLRGTESDILADGALDFDDAILAQLDVVIASVHERHRLDHERMTQRLVAAMRHPMFKIWGHPLGRYLARRPPIDCDVERVLDAAAESRVAIEVNGDPYRLDLEPRWQRAARERGIPFVLSTDAHSTAQYGNLRYAIGLARRGWLTAADVLNTRGAEEFADAVRPA